MHKHECIQHWRGSLILKRYPKSIYDLMTSLDSLSGNGHDFLCQHLQRGGIVTTTISFFSMYHYIDRKAVSCWNTNLHQCLPLAQVGTLTLR